jgi:hypothetical protein
MDHAPEKNPKQAPARERWYLRVQGRTLGPLEAQEVKFGLETGEFLSTDKIASSRNPQWILVSEHPSFAAFSAEEEGQRSRMLVTPPPPQLLRIKPQVAPRAPLPETIPAAPMPATPAVVAPPPIPERFRDAQSIPHVAPKNLRDLPDAQPRKIADAETASSLDEATKELERFLKTLRKQPETPREPVASPSGKSEAARPSPSVIIPIPERPSYEPIFIPTPEPARKSREKPFSNRTIRIELSLPARPWRLIAWLSAMAIVLFLVFSYGINQWSVFGLGENKTRDLKDSRLPDPSSPTNVPSEAGDPVPPLKAPTRPQRE